MAVTFSAGTTITSLSVGIFSTPGGQSILGVYTDNSGVPGTLVAKGIVFETSAAFGVGSFPSVYLPPGNYWLALSNSNASTSFYQGSSTVSVYRVLYTYSTTLPGTWPTGGSGSSDFPFSVYATGCY
jgi:hypothetical protein